MPTCPAGHNSTTDDFCDFCGLAFPAAPPSAPPLASAPAPPRADPLAAPTTPPISGPPPVEHCPECQLERTGNFCEGCGYNFQTRTTVVRPSGPHSGPSAPAAASWLAVIAAEPAYYQSLADRGILDPQAVKFPSAAPQRRVRLTGGLVRIGRRSASRGTDPEIDFSGAEEDPAISHQHAELRARADSSWAVVDCNSANGTAVNDSNQPIAPDTEVPLREGDRIYLGAWTVITLRRG